ncbi:two-component system, chemotaxis family, response regulator CheB [Clostridium sp. USBA 49]|uniref:protein-glutamate methylesterase/protein-glutamine glutaminase n=1 Tax=Clostridium TaxID=1485 RepID=UPI00099B1936|nr:MULTISPECIES: chemotaxis response regulator protein-glutamate methylesterase [Clostridium]SKA72749.1 two-component system, chemotaxis family, response regulator CheB [Clostridium sp. USBA 49]
MEKIKVLVVDDSALMRKIISDIINMEEDMQVIDTAKNGKDLLEKLKKYNPDVITLDVEMPIMDGIEALKEIKKNSCDIPVIMLSSVSKKGTALTMECLEIGAFDFISKPSGAISLDLNKVKDELVLKIRMASRKKNTMRNHSKNSNMKNIETKSIKRNIINNKIEAVVIGASTGGPKALYEVITAFPKNIGIPIFIVQHMPAGFTKAFAERLNNNSKITVVEAFDGQTIEKDIVYVAPGGFHMEIKDDKKIHLNLEPAIWGVRPAVDKLFFSASKVYGSHLLSIVLTGMGKDGAEGTEAIKKAGGITISEDKSTCTIYGMPKAAFETGMVDMVLPINEIASQVIKLVNS